MCDITSVTNSTAVLRMNSVCENVSTTLDPKSGFESHTLGCAASHTSGQVHSDEKLRNEIKCVCVCVCVCFYLVSLLLH